MGAIFPIPGSPSSPPPPPPPPTTNTPPSTSTSQPGAGQATVTTDAFNAQQSLGLTAEDELEPLDYSEVGDNTNSQWVKDSHEATLVDSAYGDYTTRKQALDNQDKRLAALLQKAGANGLTDAQKQALIDGFHAKDKEYREAKEKYETSVKTLKAAVLLDPAALGRFIAETPGTNSQADNAKKALGALAQEPSAADAVTAVLTRMNASAKKGPDGKPVLGDDVKAFQDEVGQLAFGNAMLGEMNNYLDDHKNSGLSPDELKKQAVKYAVDSAQKSQYVESLKGLGEATEKAKQTLEFAEKLDDALNKGTTEEGATEGISSLLHGTSSHLLGGFGMIMASLAGVQNLSAGNYKDAFKDFTNTGKEGLEILGSLAKESGLIGEKIAAEGGETASALGDLFGVAFKKAGSFIGLAFDATGLLSNGPKFDNAVGTVAIDAGQIALAFVASTGPIGAAIGAGLGLTLGIAKLVLDSVTEGEEKRNDLALVRDVLGQPPANVPVPYLDALFAPDSQLGAGIDLAGFTPEQAQQIMASNPEAAVQFGQHADSYVYLASTLAKGDSTATRALLSVLFGPGTPDELRDRYFTLEAAVDRRKTQIAQAKNFGPGGTQDDVNAQPGLDGLIGVFKDYQKGGDSAAVQKIIQGLEEGTVQT